MVLGALAVGSPLRVFAQKETTKEVCLASFGMGWSTSEEAQRHLVSLVKRDAVGELFGEVIWSMSEVKEFVLTRDEMQSFSAGLIRLRGTPQFFNGASLGEVCVTAELYVLKEDIQRLQPRTVSKKVCVADPRLSSGELRNLAQRQAQIQAVRDFEPGLQQTDDEVVLRLLHEATIDDAGFVADTLAYCATARGLVYPIEILTSTSQSGAITEDSAAPTGRGRIHIVYRPTTARRASIIESRLRTFGFEVTSAEKTPSPPEHDRLGRRRVSAEDSAGNRLYHHAADRAIAREIQSELRDLLSFNLLTSRDPREQSFTLWVVDVE